MVNDTDEELLRLMKQEEELYNYDGDDSIIRSTELKKIIAGRPPVKRYATDIRGLDEIIVGVGEGQLIALSGWTKCGKTSFCQTLTRNFAIQGLSCLWFEFESPDYEFLGKFGDSLPEFYMPKKLKAFDLVWLEKRIIETKLKADVKIVFIDHLHYLVNIEGDTRNFSLTLGGVIRKLKIMAINHKIAIVLLAHTQKPKPGQPVGLGDMRDSSFIAQESDIGIIISRKDWNEDEAIRNKFDITHREDTYARLRVLANRHNGKRGIIGLNYQGGYYVEDDNALFEG